MSQGFYYGGLLSVIMASCGNHMSVYMVVANNIHHGSHSPCLRAMLQQSMLRMISLAIKTFKLLSQQPETYLETSLNIPF